MKYFLTTLGLFFDADVISKKKKGGRMEEEEKNIKVEIFANVQLTPFNMLMFRIELNISIDTLIFYGNNKNKVSG